MAILHQLTCEDEWQGPWKHHWREPKWMKHCFGMIELHALRPFLQARNRSRLDSPCYFFCGTGRNRTNAIRSRRGTGIRGRRTREQLNLEGWWRLGSVTRCRQHTAGIVPWVGTQNNENAQRLRAEYCSRMHLLRNYQHGRQTTHGMPCKREEARQISVT